MLSTETLCYIYSSTKGNIVMSPVPPKYETQRLATLHALNLLDTPHSDRYDRITRTAQRLFNVPIALITLVDTSRIWFQSRQGLATAQTSRESFFCEQAILGDEILVIPDARIDPRVADHPLVTSEPCLRFYAGRPLAAVDGSKLGTLCILDRQVRTMDD